MSEKRFNVFDVDGTVFLEDHKEGSYHIGEKENVDIPCLNDIADRLNTYAEENEQLKQQKSFLKIIDDYFIQYEDGELFNLHKPSDIRSLMYILNRENGYSELQCEYNDLGKGDVK